jgi:non-canonical (house-cleaning) NTP pyrophosphatase
MIIAIASTRGPKVEAVKSVLASIQQFLCEKNELVEFRTVEVDGGIAMPRTLDELLRGAEQRVATLQQMLSSSHVNYFVGMEGGFHSINHNGMEHVFLQSWAYVSNGTKGCFGSSGNVFVPDEIAMEVMKKKRELSEVIDEVAKQHDVRSKQGTWGILTRDLVSRQESFEAALLAAFAPFYNKEFYTR